MQMLLRVRTEFIGRKALCRRHIAMMTGGRPVAEVVEQDFCQRDRASSLLGQFGG